MMAADDQIDKAVLEAAGGSLRRTHCDAGRNVNEKPAVRLFRISGMALGLVTGLFSRSVTSLGP